MQEKSAAKRWGSFVVAVALTWVVSFVGFPALIKSSDSLSTMAAFLDLTDIDAGQFYYTDVEVCSDAELNIRSTFEYMPRKMAGE